MPKQPIIVTVSGGVAYIASNPDNLSVSIVDYDDLNEIIHESPQGENRPTLDATDARYLEAADPDFWSELKPYVKVESKPNTLTDQ